MCVSLCAYVCEKKRVGLFLSYSTRLVAVVCVFVCICECEYPLVSLFSLSVSRLGICIISFLIYSFALNFCGLGNFVLVSNIISVSIPIPAQALKIFVIHLCCFMSALTTGVPSGTTGAFNI